MTQSTICGAGGKLRFLASAVSWMFLTFGQMITLVACVAIPLAVLYVCYGLFQIEMFFRTARNFHVPWSGEAASAFAEFRIIVQVAAFMAFCFCGAVVLLFRRAKHMAKVVARQEQENQRLWKAIEQLRSEQRDILDVID